MITDVILRGSQISLRQVDLEDCTLNYVEWLNDPDVNQFLETRWSAQNLSSIRAFVLDQRNNEHSLLFAIIDNYCGRHIGNIKIGPINMHYHHADISYFIGDKKMWGKGIASEAIRLICEYGFSVLKLHKIEAGAYSNAVGSWKALEKNGFTREANLREHVISANKYVDVYRYGLLASEFN